MDPKGGTFMFVEQVADGKTDHTPSYGLHPERVPEFNESRLPCVLGLHSFADTSQLRLTSNFHKIMIKLNFSRDRELLNSMDQPQPHVLQLEDWEILLDQLASTA